MGQTKDFDGARAERNQGDRTFTIGGQSFGYQTSVRPEALFLADEINPEMSGTEILARIDGLIEAFLLTDTDRDNWRQLRERTSDPVSIRDLNELRAFLIEEQTGRPPTPASPSSPGQESTGTNGTVKPFSEPAAASTT